MFLVVISSRIQVNETFEEEDDLVIVSDGTKEDWSTDFSVKVTGDAGLTASLKVEGTDGDINFKDTELALENGKEVKTKLWGGHPKFSER
jgi:hypothetical protein